MPAECKVFGSTSPTSRRRDRLSRRFFILRLSQIFLWRLCRIFQKTSYESLSPDAQQRRPTKCRKEGDGRVCSPAREMLHYRYRPRFGFGTVSREARMGRLLDDFVSAGKDRLRHVQIEGLCGLEIKHQFEFGRLLDW